jgi:hypothetical protein
MTTSLVSLSAGQLRNAAAIREKIDKLERELASLLGGSPAAPVAAAVARKGRRPMSAAARAKMAAAAKARWKKAKAAGKNRL